MTDIDLLKDTKSTGGDKKGNQKPPREIELSTPDSKTVRHRTLSSQAPEGFWSRISKSKKKDISKLESKRKNKKDIKDEDKFANIKTAESVVMAKPEVPIAKRQDFKTVKEPGRPHQPEISTPISPPGPIISKVEKKQPKIAGKKPASSVLPPEPKQKAKKSKGFFGQLFRKPKVEKVPEAPSLEAVKPKKELGLESKPLEVKTPVSPSPVTKPAKSEKVEKPKKEKKTIPPEPTKAKVGFLASLFKKPQVEEPPKPITLDDKGKKVNEYMPSKLGESESKLTEADELARSDFEVNLMPEELEGDLLLAKKRMVQLGLLVLGSVLVCLMVFAGLFLYESSIENKTTNLEGEIGIVEEEISLYREMQKAAINLKQRTDTINDLMDEHVYWTNFFTKLEEYTAKNVYFQSFNGDLTGGRVSLTARAASFLDVGRQLLIFQEAEDFLEGVEINGASVATEITGLGENSTERPVVDFTITLEVLLNIFNKVEEEAD